VDHDLIAAGHPQMKFEMLGYHALMPHHWNEKRDQFAGFETELWSAGQRASASAALSLLEIRAERAMSQETPWSEFSEYDCFACHHDLEGSAWRSERGFTRHGQQVLMPWGVWHFALLPELARAESDPLAREFAERFDTLKATMERSLFPSPLAVKTQAAQARNAMEAWSSRTSASEREVRLRAFLRVWRESDREPRTWDEAAQLYVAVHALMASQHSPAGVDPNPLWTEDGKELRMALGFADGYQSPRNFPKAPRTKADVRTLLSELLKKLPNPPP
jgi:hypothetical protein